MKLTFYKNIFNILSFLTDKSRGLSILVKYKLIVGSIIVALSNTSCETNQKPYVTCYEMSLIEDTVFIDKEKIDSLPINNEETKVDENTDL